MLKVIRSVVLKNVEFWNGKTFEHRDAVYLGNSGNFLSPEIAKQTNFDAEIDCDNALVMPAMFGLSLDFMAPQRDDVLKLCIEVAFMVGSMKVLQTQ